MLSNLTRRLRELGKTILPPEGAWVLVRGNPSAPQGLRIPKSHREEGVRHWDIYWAYDEQCPWDIKLRGSEKVLDEDLVETLEYRNHISAGYSSQLTWMTLHTPSSRHIRVWACEVNTMSEELIQLMLAEDYYKTASFAKDVVEPLWDDILKDTVGSLMIDGLSMSEAQDMLITVDEMEAEYRKVPLPSHYYTVIRDSAIWHGFCEEREYEAWWEDEQS